MIFEKDRIRKKPVRQCDRAIVIALKMLTVAAFIQSALQLPGYLELVVGCYGDITLVKTSIVQRGQAQSIVRVQPFLFIHGPRDYVACDQQVRDIYAGNGALKNCI